jgi:hypothetical protein
MIACKRVNLATLNPAEFLECLVFSFTGLSRQRQQNSFYSNTQRTRIDVDLSEGRANVTLEAVGILNLQNRTNADARRIVVQRLREDFKMYKNLVVRSGSQGTCEVDLWVNDVAPTMENVNYLHSLIMSAINSMERI